MRRMIWRAGAALLASAWMAAAAQSPAVNPKEADLAKAQAAQQQSQPLNNQPVWKEVRSGMPQYTSLPGRETGVLIQPEGQTWRALRNGQVSVWGGWLLVVAVLGLAGFYAYRGTIPVRGAPTGRRILRFTAAQRVIHWAVAITFVLLALSGLVILFGKNLLLPLVGYTLFSWLAILSKNLHNFVGPAFLVCSILMFFMYLRDNLPQKGDLGWFARFGGMISGEHVPSHKFNAGEKTWFWLGTGVLGLVVGVSGLVLNFPNFDQTRSTMQIANIVHLAGALVFIAMSFFHIYMGTIGMGGALDAMRTGYVDEAWAKEHHEYWYNDVRAGKIPAGDEAPRPMQHRPA